MASFLTPNRQIRTELVWCGLAQPAPNWSGWWQRIINKELGRMVGHNVRKTALDSLKKTVLIRSGFEALYLSAAHHLMRPFVGAIGAILTLHHVRASRLVRFQPNSLV